MRGHRHNTVCYHLNEVDLQYSARLASRDINVHSINCREQ